jgi:hypothetical protein
MCILNQAEEEYFLTLPQALYVLKVALCGIPLVKIKEVSELASRQTPVMDFRAVAVWGQKNG